MSAGAVVDCLILSSIMILDIHETLISDGRKYLQIFLKRQDCLYAQMSLYVPPKFKVPGFFDNRKQGCG